MKNKKLKFSRKVAYSVVLAWVVGLGIGLASDRNNDVNRVFSNCVDLASKKAQKDPLQVLVYLNLPASGTSTYNQIEAYINHLEVNCILERLK